MNLKISLFAFFLMALPVGSGAQTVRNPLNFELAQVPLQTHISSWKLSEEIFYRPDGTPFDKRSYSYDENGRKMADLTLRWNKTDEMWFQTQQCDYLTEKGREVAINRSGVQYVSRTEITSDTDGKPLYALTYEWNNSTDDWSTHPCQRSEWVYNRDGLLTTCLKQHLNLETKTWNDFDVRILYAYDEAGVLTEELYQSLNAETGQWTNGGKYQYNNVSERQKVASSFIFASDRWVSDGKTVYLYDEEGKLTRCEYYLNDADKSLNAYSINTYSEPFSLPEAIEPETVSVYPNPVVSSFELTVPGSLIGKTLQMYDVSGKQVMTLPVQNQRTQVDASRLSSGVYILKIGDLTKKIILQ